MSNATKIRAMDIVDRKVNAACLECEEHIIGYEDPEGVWLECGCDAGYCRYEYVRVIVL